LHEFFQMSIARAAHTVFIPSVENTTWAVYGCYEEMKWAEFNVGD
jgi:hypothetical protein